MTVRTYPLPELFITTGDSYIDAKTDEAFAELLAAFLDVYRTNLIGPKWGDRLQNIPNSNEHYPNGWKMAFYMTGTNMTYEEAQIAWLPLKEWLLKRQEYYTWNIEIKAIPGKVYWTRENPDASESSYDPKEPDRGFFWGEGHEVSKYWLFAWNTQYGASEWAVDELQNMPLHPSVKDSFGLMMVSFGVEHYTPLVPDQYQYNTSDIISIQTLCNTTILEECEGSQEFIDAMNNFRNKTQGAGSYFNGADFFEPEFQENFWGHENYLKLLDIKMRWDPNGLFYCHNCVGSEQWEEGGMCRR